jgi:hypothetical protein
METIMHEPRAAGFAVTLAFARVFGAFDAASTAIAGFALLAGTRAFTFTALLAWRELVGWLRWCCRNNSWTGGPPSGESCPDADAI